MGFEQQLASLGDVQLSLAGNAGVVKSATRWEAGSGLKDLSVSLNRARLGLDNSFPLTAHTTVHLNLRGRVDGGDLPMNAAEVAAPLRRRALLRLPARSSGLRLRRPLCRTRHQRPTGRLLPRRRYRPGLATPTLLRHRQRGTGRGPSL